MDASHATPPGPAPNHHRDHPGFSGPSGAVAAVGFLLGRTRAAELAIELAAVGDVDRVVDVGCGPGQAAQRARRRGAEVIGVDPARVMLTVARLRWWRRDIVWRIGAAERLPVDDGWATVAWSLATVHHWADVDRGLDEVQRVLGVGGRLVAIERRIERTDATGVASHGWTIEQANSFAQRCCARGFADVVVGEQSIGGGSLSVCARRVP